MHLQRVESLDPGMLKVDKICYLSYIIVCGRILFIFIVMFPKLKY